MFILASKILKPVILSLNGHYISSTGQTGSHNQHYNHFLKITSDYIVTSHIFVTSQKYATSHILVGSVFSINLVRLLARLTFMYFKCLLMYSMIVNFKFQDRTIQTYKISYRTYRMFRINYCHATKYNDAKTRCEVTIRQQRIIALCEAECNYCTNHTMRSQVQLLH